MFSLLFGILPTAITQHLTPTSMHMFATFTRLLFLLLLLLLLLQATRTTSGAGASLS
jgi:hypothetical protein